MIKYVEINKGVKLVPMTVMILDIKYIIFYE